MGAILCGHVISAAHLVLAQQRQMQQDLERLRIGSHDDQLSDASIECLGRCGAKRGQAANV